MICLRDQQLHDKNLLVQNQKSEAVRSKRNNNAVSSSPHIPYRNSVLTSILRDSLGGNCMSSFILNLSVERSLFEETVSTCR